MNLKPFHRRQLRFHLGYALAGLMTLLLAVAGCQRETPQLAQREPRVSFAPVLGGMGGFMIQISHAESDLVSVYHAPLKAFDRSQPRPESVVFNLLLQFNANDAGTDGLPVRLPPPPSAPDEDPVARIDEQSVDAITERRPQEVATPLPPAAGADLALALTTSFAAAAQGQDASRILRLNSVYAFDENEITLDDTYLEVIRFVRSPSGELSASVTLHNTTQQRWRARVSFLVVNRYGITLEQAQMVWTLATVSPGERRLETLNFTRVEHSDIFRMLGEDVAQEFTKPFALVVKYPE